MHQPASDTYLATEIETAPPERLRLLLIQGAIGAAETAKRQLAAGDVEAAGTALIKSHRIVAELLRSAAEDRSDLGRQVTALYGYLLRTMTAALWDYDRAKINDVISILRIEADTWQQLSGKRGRSTGGDDARGRAAQPQPSPLALPGAGDSQHSGLSIEA